MGVCMTIKNEESLWNFDNVKSLNTLSEPKTQKKKKANPFDVQEHKKAMEKSSTHSENELKAISQKISTISEKTSSINIVSPSKEPLLTESSISEESQARVDINKLLKKQNKPESLKKEESVVKPVVEKKVPVQNSQPVVSQNNNDSGLKASQDVKNALSKIKENRKTQPVFDVVAYNQQNSKKSTSLVSKQMGQFSLSVQNSVPDILKGTGWDKATTEQKNMAKKISSTICIFIFAGIVGFGLAKVSISQQATPTTQVSSPKADTSLEKENTPVKEVSTKSKAVTK